MMLITSSSSILSKLAPLGAYADGMDASLMARLEELEDENQRLKKMYAEERLKSEIIQEAMAKKW